MVAIGRDRLDISILPDEFLAEVHDMDRKKLAISNVQIQ